MPERVLPHKHCTECGTSIGAKEEFCSKECRGKHEGRIRAKKRQLLWLYFGGVGLFALAMLLLLGGGLG
ncbi:MAG: DUF2116 family Zn-ribbon domain-containing protein [Candidatus Thermoplasmatota archaeon]